MFNGFPGGKATLIRIPDIFFSDLLPQLTNSDDIRTALFVFWRFEYMEPPHFFIRIKDFELDEMWTKSFDQDPVQALHKANRSLHNLVQIGMLISASAREEDPNETIYFLNSPKGRVAKAAFLKGKWSPGESFSSTSVSTQPENIFLIYEQNIGPITPLISDALIDAENTFPSAWIHAAFKLAVERNKRNWSYIHTILRRWKEEGLDERKDKRDSQEDRKRYIEDGFPDSIDR